MVLYAYSGSLMVSEPAREQGCRRASPAAASEAGSLLRDSPFFFLRCTNAVRRLTFTDFEGTEIKRAVGQPWAFFLNPRLNRPPNQSAAQQHETADHQINRGRLRYFPSLVNVRLNEDSEVCRQCHGSAVSRILKQTGDILESARFGNPIEPRR